MASAPRYGTPNLEMLSGWFGRAPEADGPFWALNLMKYREVADYGDGRDSRVSGRAADDEYVPRDSLAAIGALIVLGADVDIQHGAEPRWDRIGIVRYPSRVAFLDMQRRDDFKRQHVHKDAGMDRTIVMSTHPDRTSVATSAPDGRLVLRVARTTDGAALADIAGATRLATFSVEGVIVGDDRTWNQVAFDVVPAEAVDTVVAEPAEEIFTMVLARPVVDRLLDSIATAPEGPVA